MRRPLHPRFVLFSLVLATLAMANAASAGYDKNTSQVNTGQRSDLVRSNVYAQPSVQTPRKGGFGLGKLFQAKKKSAVERSRRPVARLPETATVKSSGSLSVRRFNPSSARVWNPASRGSNQPRIARGPFSR